MTSDRPLLEARDVSVAFGSRTVLDGCDLRVEAAEIAVIRGPSGGGKSTLLRALATLQPLSRGQLLLEGIASGDLAPSAYRARVGYVPQMPVMFVGTVADNVRAGPRLRGVELGDAEVDALLDESALAGALRDRPAATLSGGEKQRVALARALALTPHVLLFDEPTSALDPVAGRKVVELIRRCAGRGCAVVVVTHNVEQAAAFGGTHYLCRDGRLMGAPT